MKQEIQQFRQYDEDAIRALLVGRRIVKAEEAEYPALDRYGTKPRRGCGECGHMAQDHNDWWCVDEGSGLGCSRPQCPCSDWQAD